MGGEGEVDGPRPRPLQAVPRAIVPEADGLGGVRVTDDYRGGNPRRAAYRVDDRSQLVRMSHGRLPTPPPPGHTPMSKPIMWPLAPVPEKMADCEPWSDRARARPEAQLSWVAGDGAGQQEWAGTILSSSPVRPPGESIDFPDARAGNERTARWGAWASLPSPTADMTGGGGDGVESWGAGLCCFRAYF